MLRVDKLTISVLEFTLRAYLTGKTDEIPVWRMLHASPDQLKSRAESFAERVGNSAQPVALESVVGGGSAPEAYMPSWGVALNLKGLSDAELERRLRNSNPPVIVRVEDGRVILDFRTIFPGEEEELLEVSGAAGRAEVVRARGPVFTARSFGGAAGHTALRLRTNSATSSSWSGRSASVAASRSGTSPRRSTDGHCPS